MSLCIDIELGIDSINLLQQNVTISIANIMIMKRVDVVVLASLLPMIVFVGKMIHVLNKRGLNVD